MSSAELIFTHDTNLTKNKNNTTIYSVEKLKDCDAMIADIFVGICICSILCFVIRSCKAALDNDVARVLDILAAPAIGLILSLFYYATMASWVSREFILPLLYSGMPLFLLACATCALAFGILLSTPFVPLWISSANLDVRQFGYCACIIHGLFWPTVFTCY